LVDCETYSDTLIIVILLYQSQSHYCWLLGCYISEYLTG